MFKNISSYTHGLYSLFVSLSLSLSTQQFPIMCVSACLCVLVYFTCIVNEFSCHDKSQPIHWPFYCGYSRKTNGSPLKSKMSNIVFVASKWNVSTNIVKVIFNCLTTQYGKPCVSVLVCLSALMFLSGNCYCLLINFNYGSRRIIITLNAGILIVF